MFAAPSGLNGLTLLCHQQGTTPREMFPDLRFLLTGGEAYPPEFATRMEDEWGVRFFEGYGSTESGGETASTCEVGAVIDGRRGMMHLYEESLLFEVLDLETGKHIEPGGTGRLVFTNLDKQASPMLRHDSGDRVTWLPHTACTCGRSYSGLEAGTIGRLDDMLKIKGTNIWPDEIDSVMFSFSTVAEYQGHVFIGDRGRDEAAITVEFVADETDAEARATEIAAELKRKLEVRFDVIPAMVSLPKSATSDKKVRRWVDKRSETLASGISAT
jgi:phenylacetate-CoA ligase